MVTATNGQVSMGGSRIASATPEDLLVCSNSQFAYAKPMPMLAPAMSGQFLRRKNRARVNIPNNSPPPKKHERTHSTRRLIRAGVPQGSTFSPLLYSAYTNEVPRPSSSGVQLALFADDTALFYGSRNRNTRFTLLPLQRAIDKLGQWFRKSRIEVNPDKSAAIQFKTVMTYASPVFAHAAPKALHKLQGLRTLHYFQIYEGRIEAILRYRGITSQCAFFARRLTINRRIPPTLSVGHGTYLPIHLTLLQQQLKDLMTSTTRMTDLERKGNRPVTVSCDIPMPRRLPPDVVHSACHAPSALACAVRPHSVKLSKSSDLSSDSSRPTK
ncbi:Probable RNA-directed DNA polymerase from transposon BS [Eumeta japonica]|uniref:Probable RNA-directed DNA polymerase from transposon BS n=1 Tax=Eumeta variegata TaxID=151549 RepID=A0A4C1W144_EUMVA|nr:Probable RNA-directed DNA polymerase from transposon BS [Eumeta japonica]